MTKEQFLKQLDKAFSGLPKEEKEELLQYYKEYLASAALEGENMDQVLQEIGTPEQVAKAYLEANSEVPLEKKAYRGLVVKGWWKRVIINSLFLVGFLLSCLLIIGGMASIFFLLVDIWSFKQILLFQIFEMLISIGIVYLSIIGVRQLWQTYIIRKGRFL